MQSTQPMLETEKQIGAWGSLGNDFLLQRESEGEAQPSAPRERQTFQFKECNLICCNVRGAEKALQWLEWSYRSVPLPVNPAETLNPREPHCHPFLLSLVCSPDGRLVSRTHGKHDKQRGNVKVLPVTETDQIIQIIVP